jgi:hypothetical protein
MKKLILHVGAPKCGSTSLQSILEFKERDGSLNKAGFTFPLKFSRGGTGEGNGGLVFKYFENPSPSTLTNAVTFLRNQSHSVIISDETFFSVIDGLKLKILLEEIKKDFSRCHIVTAIKEPSSWLISDYSQHIKTNFANNSFPDHVVQREEFCNWSVFFARFSSENFDN